MVSEAQSSIVPAVAACIHPRNSKDLLLVKRPPEGKYTDGRWEFPGGKIELGETPEQALVREIKEELDCKILPRKILHASMNRYPDSDKFYLILFYECMLMSPIGVSVIYVLVDPARVHEFDPLPGAVSAAERFIEC